MLVLSMATQNTQLIIIYKLNCVNVKIYIKIILYLILKMTLGMRVINWANPRKIQYSLAYLGIVHARIKKNTNMCVAVN